MTSTHEDSTAPPNKQPAIGETRASPSLHRIRHVPDWEIPVNPLKRSYLTRERVSRSWRRNRLTAALKPRPKPGSRPVLSPTSVDSLPKEVDLSTATAGSVLPTHRPSFHGFPAPPATLNGRSLAARCARLVTLLLADRKCCGFARTRLIVLIILVFLAILALALGLGLGMGLKQHQTREVPLPDDGGRTHEGDLTFFEPALGACGWYSTNADYICAVGQELFDAAGANAAGGGNPKLNPLCGRMIRVTRGLSDNLNHPNISVDVMVVDRCTDCELSDLDLAPIAFNTLAPESKGRVGGRWEWLPMGNRVA